MKEDPRVYAHNIHKGDYVKHRTAAYIRGEVTNTDEEKQNAEVCYRDTVNGVFSEVHGWHLKSDLAVVYKAKDC